MEQLPHAQDFDNFATHVKLPERMRSFIDGRRRIVVAHLADLEGPTEESWFCYWSNDYTTHGVAFLEFNWRIAGPAGREIWPDLKWRASYAEPSYLQLLAEHGLDTNGALRHHETGMGRARENVNQTILLNTWMNRRLSRMTLPEGISRLEFGPTAEWDGFGLQVSFDHNVSPEPWEEGTPGYQI